MVGRTLSHFLIVSRIGEGGMGVVYRAEDKKLHRSVALKVLQPDAVGDEERRRRFLREARAAAALTHPNIATVYEVDESDGIVFIAMEYLEGETLRSAIGGKPLRMREALRIGVEIAEGLARAHQARIVHRDLKPENTMLAADGRVKILDFGLAKLLERDDLETAERSRLETISGELTDLGRILGTAAYMSPEQARGQAVDTRSDVFAFGSVLYEMVTGTVPFQGPTAMDTLSAILRKVPVPATQVNRDVPPELERIVGKCLEKDPSERYQDTRDLVVDLRRLKRELESQPLARAETAPPAAARSGRSRRWALVLLASGAVVALAGLVTLAWRFWPSAPQAPAELRQLQLTGNPSENPVVMATLSPDGRMLAILDRNGVSVRTVDTGETQPLTLPEEFRKQITALNWFPDGARLLASADGRKGATGGIWAFSLLGGSPRRLRDDLGVRGWGESAGVSPDGSRIAFARDSGVYGPGREIWVMASDGSNAHQIATMAEGSTFGSLQWSPDGRRIADIVTRRDGSGFITTIESRPEEGGEATPIFSDRKTLSSFCWLSDGRLLYARDELPGHAEDMRLWEIRVDPATGRPSGESRLLTSSAGLSIGGLNASRDGRRLVFLRAAGGTDVHVGELEDGGRRLRQPRRLTLDERLDVAWGWTRDSRAILLSSDRSGTQDVFRQGHDGETAELIAGGPDGEENPQESPDGEWILYRSRPRDCQGDLPASRVMRTPIAGGPPELVGEVGPCRSRVFFQCPDVPGRPCVLMDWNTAQSIFFELDPVQGKGVELFRLDYEGVAWGLSPDGRRIALTPVEQPGRIVVVDLAGGGRQEIEVGTPGLALLDPRWSHDGSGFFVSAFSGGEYLLLHVDLQGRATVLFAGEDPRRFPIASPDGRHLALTVFTEQSNAWLLEGF